VLGLELPEIETRDREWVRNDLPMVAETGTDLDAVLGVDIEQAEMIGPRVTKVSREARQRTGLRRLDIITAIDGRPVHDMKELIRVLSVYEPGEAVTVDYRRVRLRDTSEVRLIERP
jgi:S1-C subfamily serine protease